MPSPLRPVVIFLATGERRVEKEAGGGEWRGSGVCGCVCGCVCSVDADEKGRRAGVRDDKRDSYMSATVCG